MAVHTQHLSSGIEKLMSNGVNLHLEVHDRYILPPHERPQLSQVSYSETIPTLDLQDLEGPNRATLIHEIRRACEEDGFFQYSSIPYQKSFPPLNPLPTTFPPFNTFDIVNHGVAESVMKNMMGIAKEFFQMPVEDRASLYSEDTKKPVRVSTSLNITIDKVLNWVDYLAQPCHPLEEVIGSWPEKPAAYRDIAGKYTAEMRELILRLLAAISEALGLDSDYLNKILGKHNQLMGINYYPSCPDPDLTIGVAGHTDASAITVLMQGDVSGLQVFKNGKWTAVEPIANALVVNLGDQLQVVSNGRFRSVKHRAVTNRDSARISIPTFYLPSDDAFIAPATSMVDEEHPALYREYNFGHFLETFWSVGLKGECVLDLFKVE